MHRSTDEGAWLKSPYDGRAELLKPEDSMRIQLGLGSDVAMCLDDVPRADDKEQAVRSKTLRTHAWARRCKEYHNNRSKGQLLFGICQGGMDAELREKSARFISGLDFDGIALGGLAIGEPIRTMRIMIRATLPHLPAAKPRYLMGVGSVNDMLECLSMGVDCFDSTFPTQNGRHGTLFTWQGSLKLSNKGYADDLGPIDKKCGCFVCRNYSRAYVHHLLSVGEPAGKKLASYHNLWFVQKLVSKSRDAIISGTFHDLKARVQKTI
jgi:queuine tRNA-ribosyltransferase